MELKDLQALVAKFRDDREWRQFHNPKDLSIALSAETAELQELFLWKNEDEVREVMNDPVKRQKVIEELADIFSFLLSFSDVEDINLEDALRAKLEKNAQNYPVEKAKGTAKKYTEL